MLCTGSLQQSLMLVGELDEDVFEAGSERTNLGHGNAVLQELLAEIVEIESIFDERMDGLSEDGGAADPGEMAGEAKSAGNFGRGDFHAQGARRLNVGKFAERIGRAIGNDLAVVNVGHVAAALGFIHVVSGYEKSDALAGKLEEEIPKLTPRDGVDPGGGLVEEKQFRLMQHGAAESEALLPAAGKLRGQAIQIGCQAIEFDNFFHAPFEARGLQAVNTPVELQVFRDGQIVVEAEILRHVPDALAYGFRIRADIEAFDLSLAAAQRKETGEHFDHRGFSAAVGTEETEDFAFFDSEADIVDGREAAEAPNEVLGGNGNFFPVHLWSRGHGFNSPLSVSHPRPCRQ